MKENEKKIGFKIKCEKIMRKKKLTFFPPTIIFQLQQQQQYSHEKDPQHIYSHPSTLLCYIWCRINQKANIRNCQMTSGMNMKLTNVKDRFYANKCPHSIAYISSAFLFPPFTPWENWLALCVCVTYKFHLAMWPSSANSIQPFGNKRQAINSSSY